MLVNRAPNTVWHTGGCAALAKALKRQLPASDYIGVRDNEGQLSHVAVLLDGTVIDAHGARELAKFQREQEFNAGYARVSIGPVSESDLNGLLAYALETDYEEGADGILKPVYRSLDGARADKVVHEMLGAN